MLDRLPLIAAAEYAHGQRRAPDDLVVMSLADNNTEFKALAQAPLREGEPVLISQARDILLSAHDEDIQPVLPGHLLTIYGSMNDAFVFVSGKRGERAATQTTAGRNFSAAMGGHLLHLAATTNVSLRVLISEGLKPRRLPDHSIASGAIETRLRILTMLWQNASEEWQSAGDLVDAAKEHDIAERGVRAHVAKLVEAEILERRDPIRSRARERSLTGYLYRIKQENGHVPPVEIVERYLGIVLLSSVLDKAFIEEGLGHLQDISQNSAQVPYLLQRSFAHSGHTGKKSR